VGLFFVFFFFFFFFGGLGGLVGWGLISIPRFLCLIVSIRFFLVSSFLFSGEGHLSLDA